MTSWGEVDCKEGVGHVWVFEEPEVRLGGIRERGFMEQAEEPGIWGEEGFGRSVCMLLSCAGLKVTASALREEAWIGGSLSRRQARPAEESLGQEGLSGLLLETTFPVYRAESSRVSLSCKLNFWTTNTLSA